MGRLQTGFSVSFGEALKAQGLKQNQLGERIAAEESRRILHKSPQTLARLDPIERRAGQWANRISAWKNHDGLPETEEVLLLVMGVVAPDTARTQWVSLYREARVAYNSESPSAAPQPVEPDAQTPQEPREEAHPVTATNYADGDITISGGQNITYGSQTVVHGDQTVLNHSFLARGPRSVHTDHPSSSKTIGRTGGAGGDEPAQE